ncbi:MAG: hypothetical protein LBS55_00195, partial [Prevotellaceae bacterium]|nr:hypothetical protein [Prevotellaceae bacterium]
MLVENVCLTPPPPSRQGRNAGVFQHIPSMRSRRARRARRARRDGALLTVFRHDGGLLRQPPTNGNNQSHRQSSP